MADPGAHPSPTDAPEAAVPVLGIGNAIMSDDGVGPAVIARLARPGLPDARVVDGCPCGLALLPHVEACSALVVVDAARLGHAPGTVSVLEGAAFDAAPGGTMTTAHEVALADLLDAADALGGRPARRALIAIEPAHVRVGTELSQTVGQARDFAVAEARACVARWRSRAPA